MEKTEMIFGTRAVMEAIKSGRQIEKIYVQAGLNNDLIKELIHTAKQYKAPYTFIPQEKLNRLSGKNHQGVVCVLSAVEYASLENIIDKVFSEGRDPFFLIVDRVTDVRNFGALARTAECASLDGIILADKGNAPITGDAMKTSAGALSHLAVCRVADMKKTIQLLKQSGIQIVACTEKASENLYAIDMNTPIALILGSEEDGISPELLKQADRLAKIPINGKIESLNVSVAAGIAIYEAVRQKGFKK
ncbi:MAG: 23S rRNA (guanosine(2251)-2'-O)-methyltransferase RlmB [Flammeovirgaceae bacterium]|jgi:23S rRNA (guanosine2251-2'-O)-methyltransferase|nr:23S rRNA (guanosine(2251)-2'-O)-methyltransferase RlmB [Flammeovirgaceae bacterium]MCZ8069286.1 23S rRNA (guanosine(2251)-2'-O)-methyltransferase RlmB [Cytophagales bacterium]